MEIDVDVRGADRAIATVTRLSGRLADGTPALYGLVDMLLEAQQERFAGRGTRWRRLSPETVRIDRQQGRDPRPLVVTGALMRSLTRRGAADQIVRVGNQTLTFGTRVFSAKFHHKGRGVPRRTVVGLTRIQRQSIVAELKRQLLEG